MVSVLKVIESLKIIDIILMARKPNIIAKQANVGEYNKLPEWLGLDQECHLSNDLEMHQVLFLICS